jgi:hypothetical protein
MVSGISALRSQYGLGPCLPPAVGESEGGRRQWNGNTGVPKSAENGKEFLNLEKLLRYSVYYDRLCVHWLSIIKEQEARLNQLEKKLPP